MEKLNNEIRVPIEGLGCLVATANTFDSNFPHISVCLELEDKTLIDLSMIAVPRGEIAVARGLSEDNKDIDIYTFGDVYTEDYSRKDKIKYTDVQEAMELI